MDWFRTNVWLICIHDLLRTLLYGVYGWSVKFLQAYNINRNKAMTMQIEGKLSHSEVHIVQAFCDPTCKKNPAIVRVYLENIIHNAFEEFISSA